MNFKFYIFGIPDGFNLFQGNADDTSYFLSFYDGSKENKKLSIHRRENGQVSYSYLKYGLLSDKDRGGAFFGMSVVFNGEYCYDVESLYRLFDYVYNERIIKNKILLQEIKENPNAQAKFLISAFKEREAEVRNIENIILKNIKNKFTNDIRSLDSSFKQGKPNLIRKMNTKKSNDDILEALRDYLWISISPEYPEEVVDEISEEGKKAFNDTSVEIKDAIINNYDRILSEDIDVVRENIIILECTINDIQDTIKNYIKSQSGLKDLEITYKENKNQLNNLKTAIEKKSSKKQDTVILVSESKKNKEKETCDSRKTNKHKKESFFRKILNFLSLKKIVKWTIVTVIIVFIALALNFIFFEGGNAKNTKTELYIQHNENFENYLSEGDFENAWKELEILKKNGEKISSQQKYLITKIKSEVEKEKEKNTEEGWNNAKALLENSVKYGNDEEEITQDIIDFTESKRLLQANNDFSINAWKNVKEKCSVILKSDCSTDIINEAENLLEKAQAKINNAKESTQEQDSEKLVINISICNVDYENCKAADIGQSFKVGEKLIIVAKKGTSLATCEKWKLEDQEGCVKVNQLENPIRVELKRAGDVTLTYKDQSCILKIRR